MIKKVLSIILSLSMLLPLCFTVNAENEENTVITSSSPFTDISGHWAEDEIKYMYNSGLVSGVSETEFCPDMTIDKAQFITMVVRALGVEEDIYSLNYSDIDIISDWFAGYVGGAVNAGIVENSVFPFLPEEKITRASAAVMLYNALAYTGLLESTGNKICNYEDVSNEDAELLSAVSAVSEMNIMVGQSENYFAADSSITRAEAATVVKRLSLASETVGEVLAYSTSEADGNDIIKISGNGAYAEIENLDFHYGLNKLSVEATADKDELQLELWIDSLNPLSGTKLGTVLLEKGSTYKEQTALINRAYGTHKAYLRLVGDGEVSIKNVSLNVDEIQLNVKERSALSGMTRSQTKLTDIKAGGYIEFNGVEFGTGYDTIEITMENSTAGQMLEVWVDDLKATVVETLDSGDEGITLKVPVVKANGTKKLSIKAITQIDGSISNIRFYNLTGKADVMVASDKFEDDLEVSMADDGYDSYTETEALKDGDVLKLPGVNLSDGYNVLTLRMRHPVSDMPGVVVADETGNNIDAYLMSIPSEEDEAYIEVRLDSPNGKKVGVIKNNPIDTGTLYDTQSCYLYDASGIRDVYLKTVGNINWNIGFAKFQERGWYDSGIMTLEAENMDVHKGTVTNPKDASRYVPNTIESESSGKATVKISDPDGYVEFTVPEVFAGEQDRTAITVRHSITDVIDENNLSVGQDGKLKISINGAPATLIDYFKCEETDSMKLSSKYSKGYAESYLGIGNSLDKKGDYGTFYYDDGYGVIKGTVKPGDKIRLMPQIDENVTECYIDCVDIENIPKALEKPDNFLSITDMGAIPNDDIDDGVALRAACDEVRENPYAYSGVWIPQGHFNIKTFIGDSSKGASFDGIRVMGAGMWYSRLQSSNPDTTWWNVGYSIDDNTVLNNFAMHGEGIQRGNGYDGKGTNAICLAGIGAVFASKIWMEHWIGGMWNNNGTGVYRNNRIKNTWADGLNIHGSGSGVAYERNFVRATGDDGLAIFSNCSEGPNCVKDIKIKNNNVSGVWHASGIALWGADNVEVTNNLVSDSATQAGIVFNSWGYTACAVSNAWIRNNRIERCGNRNSGSQDQGAFGFTPGEYSESYNTTYYNLYIENNETIDNPSVFLRISTMPKGGSVDIDVRYNYIRNTCLSFPERRRLFQWQTADTKGTIRITQNLLDGEFVKLLGSNSTQMTEVVTGNIPNNWN